MKKNLLSLLIIFLLLFLCTTQVLAEITVEPSDPREFKQVSLGSGNTGNPVIEWSMSASDTDSNGVVDLVVGVADSSVTAQAYGDMACIVKFGKSGKIAAYNASGYVDGQGYALDKEYKIKLVIDIAAGTYDVYIDDVLKFDDYAYRASAVPLTDAGNFVYASSDGNATITNLSSPAAPVDQNPSPTAPDAADIAATVEPSDPREFKQISLGEGNTGNPVIEWTQISTDTDANGVVDLVVGVADSSVTAQAYGDMACIVKFGKSGKIAAYNASGYVDGQYYALDKEYKIKLVIDIAAGTYDVYIDDVLKFDDYAYRASAVPLTDAGNLVYASSDGNAIIAYLTSPAILAAQATPEPTPEPTPVPEPEPSPETADLGMIPFALMAVLSGAAGASILRKKK